MFKGIAFALSACFIWGLIFIIPQFMSSFSSIEIALGRYLFYGGISILFLLKARLQGFCRYPLSVWIKALYLSLLSGYYLWVIVCSLGCVVFLCDKLDAQKYFTWNHDSISFFIGCGILGLLCSWVGAVFWNKASVYLTVSLTGQLMVFETIFGVLFVYTLDQQLPSLMECCGIVLLLGAVICGIRLWAILYKHLSARFNLIEYRLSN